MKITLAKSLEEFYSLAAWRIASAIIQKPDAVIGLATGRTTGGIHRALAEIYAMHPFDTSRVTVLPMDEVTGVDRAFSGSCYDMILRQVVEPLHIPMEHFLNLPTRSEDFDRDCRAFEAEIAARGGVDLQVLGIGENGHLGFNQPGTPFESVSWHSRMDEQLEARLRRESGAAPEDELGGVTLGIQNIMMSRRILLVANGAHKRDIVRQALLGPVTTDVPASVLRLHPFAETILDPEAGEGLPSC